MNDICKALVFSLLVSTVSLLAFTSCEHEIDYDYPPAETIVVFDGQISNEDLFVRISHSRPMSDSTKSHWVDNAQVWITNNEGKEEQLIYDKRDCSYRSNTGLTGIPGHTYNMRATVDGHQYEATTTMQQAARIDTVFFRYIKVFNERMFFVCVRGKDPNPDELSPCLCRLMRRGEVFRWTPRTGRSSMNGSFEYDIPCSTESAMEDGIDEEGKIPLMDGDTLTLLIMTIDKPCCDYFSSLMISESTTTNPLSNIRGGAQGIFMAANITRAEPIVFNKEALLNNKE